MIVTTKSSPTIHTFGELLDKVGSTNHIHRIPCASRIRKSDAEVLLTEQIFDAAIAVFDNGFVIYSRNEHETVTAVDRCASPVYAFSASTEEVKEGFGVAGCECHFIRKKKWNYSSVNCSERNFSSISLVCTYCYHL
ncbi:MAG: hypothetical protein LUF29_08240 [Oscillospiraceae bacterium]|nr:hypothetical protein [Oscillospiraceae bacterium]